MKTKIYTCLFTALLINTVNAFTAKSQESVVDTIPAKIEQLSTDILDLKKLKISGYIQGQAQFADTVGQASIAGGNFGSNINKRMMIRRGRVKFAYSTPLSQSVLQLDITEKAISLKDAYIKINDMWTNYFTLTFGQFNRPFGYEIEYSSSLRESPERSRIIQTIFPGERDLGSMITIQAPKTSRYNFLKLDAGLFGGNGPNVQDFDNRYDFISHLTLNKTFLDENLKIGVGTSYYTGFFKNTGKEYKMGSDKDFIINTSAKDYAKRSYLGFDFQASLYSVAGITTLRGEYIYGTQPASSSSSSTPTAFLTSTKNDTLLTNRNVPYVLSTPLTSGGDTYVRDFYGYYIYLCQDIFKTKHSVVIKYDVYDPNTKVKGTEIGKKIAGKATNNADIQYSTLGLGWIYHYDSNIKFTLYYDMITNEKTSYYDAKNKIDYRKDIKDNVVTLRVQYKF